MKVVAAASLTVKGGVDKLHKEEGAPNYAAAGTTYTKKVALMSTGKRRYWGRM